MRESPLWLDRREEGLLKASNAVGLSLWYAKAKTSFLTARSRLSNKAFAKDRLGLSEKSCGGVLRNLTGASGTSKHIWIIMHLRRREEEVQGREREVRDRETK